MSKFCCWTAQKIKERELQLQWRIPLKGWNIINIEPYEIYLWIKGKQNSTTAHNTLCSDMITLLTLLHIYPISKALSPCISLAYNGKIRSNPVIVHQLKKAIVKNKPCEIVWFLRICGSSVSLHMDHHLLHH